MAAALAYLLKAAILPYYVNSLKPRKSGRSRFDFADNATLQKRVEENSKWREVMETLCLLATLWCPQYNVEFIDLNGNCVYVCVDGKPICPCITGPFDDMHDPELIDVEARNGR